MLMFGFSGRVSQGFLFMSSLAWAKTNCKELGGIIKGFTLLIDKTLMYS